MTRVSEMHPNYLYYMRSATFGTSSSLTNVSKLCVIFWDRETYTIFWDRVVVGLNAEFQMKMFSESFLWTVLAQIHPADSR